MVLAGEHAGHGVPSVLERLRDVLDVVGFGGLSQRLLGRLVGVEGSLIVLAHRRVEGSNEHVRVEPLELLAEPGDVLFGDLLDRGEVFDVALFERAHPVLLRHGADQEDDTGDHGKNEEEVHAPHPSRAVLVDRRE